MSTLPPLLLVDCRLFLPLPSLLPPVSSSPPRPAVAALPPPPPLPPSCPPPRCYQATAAAAAAAASAAALPLPPPPPCCRAARRRHAAAASAATLPPPLLPPCWQWQPFCSRRARRLPLVNVGFVIDSLVSFSIRFFGLGVTNEAAKPNCVLPIGDDGSMYEDPSSGELMVMIINET